MQALSHFPVHFYSEPFRGDLRRLTPDLVFPYSETIQSQQTMQETAKESTFYQFHRMPEFSLKNIQSFCLTDRNSVVSWYIEGRVQHHSQPKNSKGT